MLERNLIIMKKSNLIAMVASFATVAACAISTATVFAAEPSVNLVKVDEDTVAVYFANIPDTIWTWDMTISMENVTKATWTPDAAAAAVFETAGSNIVGNDLLISMSTMAGEYAIASGEGTKMGEIDLTITDATADVVLTPSVVNIQDVYEVDYKLSDGSIAAPALTLSNKPVVTYHKDVTADKVAESTELLDAPARGYEATVNYANGTVGKLVWSITAAEQTKTVDATAAEVSGQPTVIYGLIIVDANVDKVDEVVLKNVVE